MSFSRHGHFYLATLLLWLALLPASSLAASKVVVSIKPLELLVRAVATDDTSVTTLVPPGANPHKYAMKPSGRQALAEADAVFWVGPELESFLSRLLTGSEFADRSHALGNNDSTDDSHAEHSHDHDHHGHESDTDPHVWLDPELARQMARQIHSELSKLPGADTTTLNGNLARFEQALTETERTIQKQLAPARELSLFTYHNAFNHFAEHYNLTLSGVLTLNPDLSPGARHVAEIQERLGEVPRPCLMTEQPYNPDSWHAIVGDINVAFSAWDPLGSAIEPSPDAYIQFQKSVAQAVLNCL
ncbi:zinc ABC transporter substrate-binding protein [Marinobacter sp. CHS3-4]|uniref:zinc ABC transporter substrate-binding protein n=1 Tax=Marinobacter sp. CHS3-4 TaxID=3045174 RepID=UPI0024B517BA|nr:zinc ABC transporter substrate-binding protein [Marinobacter sp. CHS3-4]MDI9245830.1 zinc ABC transporter substrate-binding protein [Marinobacter sp. CHS3-4]